MSTLRLCLALLSVFAICASEDSKTKKSIDELSSLVHGNQRQVLPEMFEKRSSSSTDEVDDELRKLLRYYRQEKNQKIRHKNHKQQELSNSLPPSYVYSLWTPATSTISRPYFIPAWGSSGSVPMYFPPQPLLINPGYPPQNPPPNRQYLPPYENPPSSTVGTDILNRFGDDDRPVWDMEEAAAPSVQAPSSAKAPSSSKASPEENVIPTRRPRPPSAATSTLPPVVHHPNDNTVNSLSASNIEKAEENKISAKPPSRCVWAIISCCSSASEDVSNACFEQLGCSGPFWDTSPCNSEFAKAAIEAALNYYEDK